MVPGLAQVHECWLKAALKELFDFLAPVDQVMLPDGTIKLVTIYMII